MGGGSLERGLVQTYTEDTERHFPLLSVSLSLLPLSVCHSHTVHIMEGRLWSDHAIMSSLMSRMLVNRSLDCLWARWEWMVRGLWVAAHTSFRAEWLRHAFTHWKVYMCVYRCLQCQNGGVSIHVCCCTLFSRELHLTACSCNTPHTGRRRVLSSCFACRHAALCCRVAGWNLLLLALISLYWF